MLREAKGLVSLGSHTVSAGEVCHSLTIKSHRQSGPVQAAALYVKYAKYAADMYVKYVKYVANLYVKYVKYGCLLCHSRHFCKLSPTATNGYV